MTPNVKTPLVGGLRGLVAGTLLLAALLLVTARPLFAQAPEATPTAMPTHEQMHQMTDMMHGEGASDRMHDVMGEEGEQMMDQCVQMMAMMQGMMGSGNAMNMTNGMSMMNLGQSMPSMQDTMRGMMGQ